MAVLGFPTGTSNDTWSKNTWMKQTYSQENKPHQVAISLSAQEDPPLQEAEAEVTTDSAPNSGSSGKNTMTSSLVKAFGRNRAGILGFGVFYFRWSVKMCQVECRSWVKSYAFILPQTFWFEDARERVKGCNVWRRVHKSWWERCPVWRMLALLWKLYKLEN